MNTNMNDISGFDAMTEEIRYVYAERDRLRDENKALLQFKKDICEVLGVGGNSHNDGVVKVLKAVKSRANMEADNARVYGDILDELKKYFKMTAPHWKYSDIPHFIKTAHEFALEKCEDAEDALREFGEDICKILGVDYDMSTDATIFSEVKRLRESVDKQEEFTEEAASILGVNLNDLSLSDVLEALRKLKRYEELNNMNCEIIADLKTELDQSQRAFSGEHSRRLAAEKYISDTFQRAAKELGMTRIPDGIDRLCDEIADLRNYRNRISCPKEFWEAICDIMEMDACDSTPSDVIGMMREAKKRLIYILALNPNTATWTDVYDAIKAEQKDHCNLISESYKMKHELAELNVKWGKETGSRVTAERYISDSLSKICSALGIEYSTDTTLEYILDTIDDLRGTRDTYSHSFGFCRICEYLGIEADGATLSDIRDEIKKLKDWKTGCTPSLYFKWFKGLCDSLGMDQDSTTWQDIFNEIEGLRAKYLNLCGDFSCCCDKLGLDITERNRSSVMARIDELKDKTGANSQSLSIFWIKTICTCLGISPEDSTLEDILDGIENLKSWKTVAEDHDKRRREWVRKYKSEHERANSCDELYKKYKALYDADAPKRQKLSDDLETYRSSYEAIKNVATKNRSLMNTVAQLVGTVGMHDDVTMAGVQNAKKKANHWDILVDSYGEGTIRSLLDNIGIDVSGDKGNGLFR